MGKVSEYLESAQNQLDNLNAKIDQLKDKADQAEAGAKDQYSQLVAKRDQAKQKLAEFKVKGEAASDELKKVLEQVVSDLKNGFDSVAAKFK